jgi:NADPH-dependent 2,4-dienoyl-CoA reductase/sulfur reductase-like enzyme
MSTSSSPTPALLERVVVVGASLAGLRAAETLRQHGDVGEVVVIGGEPHRPYDRPPLSKKLLAGEWDADRVQLRQPEAFDALDVEWRLGVSATALDLGRRRIVLDDGDEVAYGGLVIATGARPRRLPDQDAFDHVHELRTIDDSMRLRAELTAGDRRVVVIGAGFIGLEVASTAASLGNRVTVLEGAEAPLVRGLGAELGTAVGELHRRAGVEIRCDVRIDAFTPEGVRLADGEVVGGDVVVVGIGVSPVTDWLDTSGLQLRDGVVCNANLQALDRSGSAVPGVFAVGDVARWYNALFDEEMRVEHWTNAAEQGAHAADNVRRLGRNEPLLPYAAVPFFWSDQGANRIQFLGRAAPDDEVRVVAGSVDDGKFLALYGREGRLHGALGVNAPRWVMPLRSLLLEGAGWDEAIGATSALDA